MIERVCVFCGSSPGVRQEYVDTARLLGKTLAERKLALVYGGAKVGLMGQVAKSCLEASGKVIGVIPKHLADMEVAFEDISKLHVVETMHERKMKMSELSDSFIALPGGIGTLEELLEILTWGQLGLHCKPCGVLNILGYYDKLIEFLAYSVEQKFMEVDYLNMLQVGMNPEELLLKFEKYVFPKKDKAKWVLELTEKIKP